MEEGNRDELAEEKEVDSSVLGDEELDSEEVLGGGEGELGGDVADDHPGSPASIGQYRLVNCRRSSSWCCRIDLSTGR